LPLLARPSARPKNELRGALDVDAMSKF